MDGEQSLVYLPEAHPDELFDVINEGGFEAANFVDWTAEGYIKALCPALERALAEEKIEPLLLGAYSVIGQPDFFPMVKQQDIAEWWKTFPLRDAVWPSDGIAPTPLSDKRVPANFKLKGSGFDSADTTITAIVGLPPRGEQYRMSPQPPKRESTLSYRASDVFDPGWDTAQDFGRDAHAPRGTNHLANYGLGSPFPEDTQICAALGAFWPGAVPDLARFFAPFDYPTTTPLTDDEAKSWNGVKFPERQGDGVEYQSFKFADYVEAIREGRLDYEKFALLDLQEFILRTEITARFYQHLQILGEVANMSQSRERAKIAITSFQYQQPSPELIAAGWLANASKTFRIEWSRAPQHTKTLAHPKVPTHPEVTLVKLEPPRVTFVGHTDEGLAQAAKQTGAGAWQVHCLP
jgi:hypothetical protein